MKKITSSLLAFLMLFTCIFGVNTATYAASPTVTIKVKSIEKYDYANDAVTKTNAQRAKYNQSKLKIDSALTKYAMQRAAELAANYSHTRPDGTSGITIAKKVNGENIACGQSSPQAVMTTWMNSKGHKENILRSTYKSIGIGCAEMDGYIFWVQLFSKSAGDGKKITGTKCATKNVKVTKSQLFFYFNTYNIAQDLDLETTGLDYDKRPKGYTIEIDAVDKRNNAYNGVCDAIVDNSTFTFTSSNPSIFTVSSTGLINIKKTGTAVLTAKLKSNTSFVIKTKVAVRRKTNISGSPASFVYNGNVQKPRITITDLNKNVITSYEAKALTNCKNVGKHTIRIRWDEEFLYDFFTDYRFYDYDYLYSYYDYIILPKGTAVSKLAAGSKSLTVAWKKQATQTSGYQIQIATNSGFTSGVKNYIVASSSTTSKKLTKLSGKKKYYVRVRTYKATGGTVYYSSWSGAKAITTKR